VGFFSFFLERNGRSINLKKKEMSARPVVKTSHMPAVMQEFAIMAAQVNFCCCEGLLLH
jgi:hypothetical protein